MRGLRWRLVLKWLAAVLLLLALACGFVWVVNWAIVVNDRDRTPAPYRDP